MATRTMKVRVCDKCGSEKDVEHYFLSRGAPVKRRLSFDACAECTEAAPLVEWERLRGAGSGRRLVRKVVDPSVIEKAAKKKR